MLFVFPCVPYRVIRTWRQVKILRLLSKDVANSNIVQLKEAFRRKGKLYCHMRHTTCDM